MFSSVHALSKKGRCTPFDSGADGIALGEGIATVVLKRLADARRDGAIHAVINAYPEPAMERARIDCTPERGAGTGIEPGVRSGGRGSP